MEGVRTLVDWGVRTVKGDRNIQSLAKVEAMLGLYHPTVLVLEDHSSPGSRRSARMRELNAHIREMASCHKVPVQLFSNGQIRRAFFGKERGTKHALATLLAEQFPEELASRLPPKRRAWMSEAYQMSIFDAAALAMMCGRQWGKQSEE